MRKYILGTKRKLLTVSPQVHSFVKLYAIEHNLTIVEATYELFRKVFAITENLELEENMEHNREKKVVNDRK